MRSLRRFFIVFKPLNARTFPVAQKPVQEFGRTATGIFFRELPNPKKEQPHFNLLGRNKCTSPRDLSLAGRVVVHWRRTKVQKPTLT
jgi:hypothetical protein